MAEEEIRDILKRYKGKISGHVEAESEGLAAGETEYSSEYQKFRVEVLSEQESWYERWCNRAEKIIAFAPTQKELPDVQKAIETAHLNMTPIGAASFSALLAFTLIILGFLIFGLNFAILSLLNPALPFEELLPKLTLFPPLLFMILGVMALFFLKKMPSYLASSWRLKASNQMVLCILYIVIYMRHTSNLEHAIKFAAQHIGDPLALDLRKVFWDIETRKYSTIKESLDAYLEKWRRDNLEFVTAFHLIEASLYEPTESRRLDLLDKSLAVILDGTYEKMLHYAQDLKSPITTLYMLGVILPILGLVIFPLVGSLLQGLVSWYHLAFLYNIMLPAVIFAIGYNVLSKRPTGYGESRTIKAVYEKAFDPFWIAFFIAVLFIIAGLFPIITHALDPRPENDIELGAFGKFLGYQQKGEQSYGPFGIGALLISFLIPLGLALSLGFYYNQKTKKLIELREETTALEREFASALFQLGNRIGDGIPSELAFNKVAVVLEGTPTGNFFRLVDVNIRQLGMGLDEAIFDPKIGAINSYPSPLVESSMEVLVEGSKKGPKIVSQSLISISQYVDRIHKVNERLKDLLSEIVSSMKSQIAFLTPAIAGIVVGISSMIVNIIVGLTQKFAELSTGEGAEALGGGGLQTLITLFGIEGIIPAYYFQLVVGIYVVELVIVLTIIQAGIEYGNDKVYQQYYLGKNIMRSVFLYIAIAVIVVVLFNFLASNIITQGGF